MAVFGKVASESVEPVEQFVLGKKRGYNWFMDCLLFSIGAWKGHDWFTCFGRMTGAHLTKNNTELFWVVKFVSPRKFLTTVFLRKSPPMAVRVANLETQKWAGLMDKDVHEPPLAWRPFFLLCASIFAAGPAIWCSNMFPHSFFPPPCHCSRHNVCFWLLKCVHLPFIWFNALHPIIRFNGLFGSWHQRTDHFGLICIYVYISLSLYIPQHLNIHIVIDIFIYIYISISMSVSISIYLYPYLPIEKTRR